MNNTSRYNPVVERYTIRDFGNKFFRQIDEINFDKDISSKDDIIYPIGWDDKHDRGLVWDTTDNMSKDFINGIQSFTTNNPINIIDLVSNVRTLDSVKEKKDIKYWQSFIDEGYNYFVFIGKNRTLTSIYKVWKSLVNNESTYSDLDKPDYVIEVKIFDRNFDNVWKGEFYRGEKTQYADSPIMMYVSYDCPINDYIYDTSTKNPTRKPILNSIFDKNEIIQYVDRWWVFTNLWYFVTQKWKNDLKKMEKMWENKEDVPPYFNTLLGKLFDYIDYVDNRYASFANKKKVKKELLSVNFLKLAWMILIELHKSGYGLNVKKKNDDLFEKIVDYFLDKIDDTKTIYGYTEKEKLFWKDLKKGLSYSVNVYSDENRTINIGKEQTPLMLKALQTELIDSVLISNEIVVKKEKRKSFTTEDQLSLFKKSFGRIRVNGCKEKSDGSIEWFSDPTKPLYKEYTKREFMAEKTHIDHIDAIARSGTNNTNNLELATEEFNLWKGSDRLIQ